MSELIDLIESVKIAGYEGLIPNYKRIRGLTRILIAEAVEGLGPAGNPNSLVDYVHVNSPFYPGLRRYYQEEARHWVARAKLKRRNGRTWNPIIEVRELSEALEPPEETAVKDESDFRKFAGRGSLSDAWRRCRRLEWLLKMLDTLNKTAYEHELRLFLVWCARKALANLDNPDDIGPYRNALDISESFAMGRASLAELRFARRGITMLVDRYRKSYMGMGMKSAAYPIVLAVEAALLDDPISGARIASKVLANKEFERMQVKQLRTLIENPFFTADKGVNLCPPQEKIL